VTWTPVDSDTAGFADGNAGHVFELGSAPQAGDIDVLFVNSDTIVSTPSGWTLPTNGSHVANQGAYAFYRVAAGGEGDDVTITTSGDHNCAASWSRWRGGNAFEIAVKATVDGSTGGTTPAVSTGTLAETGELVIAGALLHRLASPEPTTPVWSSGYTGLTSVTQGTGNPGCVQFVGYRTDAGTAAETPNVTWTNGAFDRYIIVLAFTQAAGGSAVSGDVSQTATAAVTATGANAAAGAATATTTAGSTATGTNAAAGAATSTTTAGATTTGQVAAAGEVTGTTTAAATVTASNAATGATSSTTTAAVTAAADVIPPVEPGAEQTITATATVEAEVTRAQGGGWYGLLSILTEARDIAREEEAAAPVACPNDGEPLQAGPRGELHCPFDGYVYDGRVGV
jgi:hypothetical protein